MTEDPDVRLKRAKQELLQASEKYDAEGHRFETRAKKHFSQFIDDPEGRAEEILEAARETNALIDSFSGIHASLMSRASFVAMQMQSGALSLQLRLVADGMEAFGTGRRLNEDDYLGVARQIIGTAVQAFELAAGAIDLRRATLGEFLGEMTDVSVADILESMLAVARQEAAEGLISGLGQMFPGVQPLLKAIDYLNKVREHLDATKPVYRGRGPEDDMFEFRRALRTQSDVLEGIGHTMGAQLDAMQALTASSTSG